MTDHLYTIDEIKSLITPICMKHHIHKLAVFGSYATSSACETSDIDFLVETQWVFDLDAYGDFEEALEDALGKNVDIVFYNSINPHMRDSVLREAVVLYEQ